MTSPETFRRHLERLQDSDDFALEIGDAIDGLPVKGSEALPYVREILAFMETHPDMDYGSPGSLVRFAEKSLNEGYEEALLNSTKRKPTPHTLWMLNRLINGAPNESIRIQGLATLQDAANNRSLSEETRHSAKQFAALQRQRGH